MECNSEIYLSPQYTKNEYKELNLNINSDNSVWEKAVNIFSDRIKGRFLNQIDSLSSDINANGFAIMALNCLLVETLFQFRKGLGETPSKKNGILYARFLKSAFPTAFDSIYKAIRFYQDIRCGILHSAQTKGDSRLTCDDSYFLHLDNQGVLSVSVERFSSLIRNYFNEYKRELLDESQIKLRTNFVKKMEYVCR